MNRTPSFTKKGPGRRAANAADAKRIKSHRILANRRLRQKAIASIQAHESARLAAAISTSVTQEQTIDTTGPMPVPIQIQIEPVSEATA